ncbi:MAG: hypothetical protein COA49_08445 [Bacteroidetes bacterium]|nr:MAG: hypothetical protein COA49_08445 [Bacteroidota bacterium]
MSKLPLAVILVFLFFQASAQTCPFPTELSSKSLKLFEKATESKKNKKLTTDEKIELLYEAIEIQDDYGETFGVAYEAISKLLFKSAKRNTELVSECRIAIEQWTSACANDINNEFPEANYMLGVLAFISGETEVALNEFELFLELTETNENKSILRKRRDAKSLLPEVKFEIQYFANSGLYTPTPLPNTSLSEDEYLPALSPDGTILLFTRARNKKSRGDVMTKRIEEFTMSRRMGPNDLFSQGQALDYPFNIGDNYGGVSLSIDNRLLIIATSNPVSGNPQNIDLFSTTYKVDGIDDEGHFIYYWDDLKVLGPEINTEQGWESQPALSSDGRELFFASARKNSTPDSDGNPTMDIFVSEKDENGKFTQAIKLPYPISTGAQEKAPFLHPDGNTLYFSSNRKPSGGGYDIWMTKRDSIGVWSDPVNFGTPVNTDGDEHGLVVSANGKEAFFASRRPGTKGLDILTFPVPESLRPEEIVVIHGVVDPTPPSDDVRLTLEYVQSKQVEEIELNKDDGSFAAIIHTARVEDVILHVNGDNLAFEAKVVYLVEDSSDDKDPKASIASQAITVRAEKASEIDAFELEDVQFETNKSRLTKSTKLILGSLSEYLIEHPKLSILIEGHTDNIGSSEDNLLLSEIRAEVVANFLKKKGISSSRISSAGFGEERPKSDNSSEEGRANNRRTEFTVK